MADRSTIEWTDATWTPIRARYLEIQNDGSGKERIGWHCTHVSEGCRFCYAERINLRLGTGRDYKPAELYRPEHEGYHNGEVKVFLDEKMLAQPLRWQKPRKIFVCSMTDLFAEFHLDEWIDRVFAVMALCPQHTFMVLTKRAKRMRDYIGTRAGDWMIKLPDAVPESHVTRITHGYLGAWPLPNTWLGVSVEDQTRADARIPELLATPAAKRFISAEPLLGPVDLMLRPAAIGGGDWDSLRGRVYHSGASLYADSIAALRERTGKLDWVIVGGESGPGARPMHPDWARSLRDQCTAAGVAFFFKQYGEWISKLDRDVDDPDWRGEYTVTRAQPDKYWILNLASGTGFHGERVQLMKRVGKKAAGALLDGVEHREWPA